MSNQLMKKESRDLATSLTQLETSNIRSFGSEVQKSISKEVDTILDKCKTFDCGEATQALSALTELTSPKPDTFAQKLSKPFKQFLSKHKSINSNLDLIVSNVDKSKEQLIDSLQDIETLANNSKEQYNAIEPYQDALKVAINETETKLILLSEGSIDYLEMVRKRDALQRRLDDLTVTRVVAEQTIKECILLVASNQILVDEMQYTIDNVIPLWKSQALTAINVKIQSNVVNMTQNIRRSTNDLLISNAKNISNNVKNIQGLTEGTIIDVSTLETVNDIMKALTEDMQKRSESNKASQQDALRRLERLHGNMNTTEMLEDAN